MISIWTAAKAQFAFALFFLNASVELVIADDPTRSKTLFEEKIRPLMIAKCGSCHGPLKQEGALRIDSGKALAKGGDSGAALDNSEPLNSEFFVRITSSDASIRMPPEGKPLSAIEIDTIREWLQSGAKYPLNENTVERPEDHWFFHPPAPQSIPNVTGYETWDHPIDRFLAEEWVANGLEPAPELTDKRRLLRRVSIDLNGIPPSLEQVSKFLADDSGNAYERVVDELLKSPPYGVRWGRHWMDVWRSCDESQDDT